MDPQIALQLILTLAKISGTILAMFMAVIIFALRDEDLARLILLKETRGYAPLLTLLSGCFALGSQIIISILETFHINLGESYDDLRMVFILGLFSLSIVLVLGIFVTLLLEKRGFLKMRGQTRK